MGDKTGIEWTDATWNPTRGCTPVSPGCKNCYAMRQAVRMSGPGGAYEGLVRVGKAGPQWTGDVRLATSSVVRGVRGAGPRPLTLPLRWNKPKRIFVDSMSDLFHEDLPTRDVDKVFAVMAISAMRALRHEKPKGHTFQVVTKRHARMRDYLSGSVASLRDRIATQAGAMMEDGDGWHDAIRYQMPWPLPNVWMIVSVEDQPHAELRIPDLLDSPAAIRGVSYEPALGPVDFGEREFLCADWRRKITIATYLDWIIVGGESGTRARPFDVAWARDVVRQCKNTRTACFIKQMGARPVDGTCDRCHGSGELAHEIQAPGLPRLACPLCDGGRMPVPLDDSHGGDMAEWPKDLRVRQFPGDL